MKKIPPFLVALCLFLKFSCVTAQDESISQCLSRLVTTASQGTTVAELHAQCGKITADEIDTVTEEVMVAEDSIATNEYSLLQHRPNYLLPIAYNFKVSPTDAAEIPDIGVTSPIGDTREFDRTEFKFQLSFKTLIWDHVLGSRAKVYAAYTNTSWWQAYNRNESRPFRETNHQPELILEVPSDLRFGGWELANMRFSINHKSNGRSGEFSRTWNRAYAEFIISNDSNELWLSPWLTFSSIDDNQDIEEYAGRFEIGGKHLFGNHTLNWKARHTLDRNSRGAVEVDWSFPISGREDIKFFLQYFDGYAESLIDYNQDVRRFGLGFKLGL